MKAQQHVMFVCTTCASVWKDGKRVGESGGEKLFKQLQQLHQEWELREEFAIQPVECMSSCNRACAISFASPGKYTYLFGDLATDLASTEVVAVYECASKYYNHPEGLLPWSERPQLLKKGILAKIPSVPASTSISHSKASLTV
jgi:predicted metal-binding protein